MKEEEDPWCWRLQGEGEWGPHLLGEEEKSWPRFGREREGNNQILIWLLHIIPPNTMLTKYKNLLQIKTSKNNNKINSWITYLRKVFGPDFNQVLGPHFGSFLEPQGFSLTLVLEVQKRRSKLFLHGLFWSHEVEEVTSLGPCGWTLDLGRKELTFGLEKLATFGSWKGAMMGSLLKLRSWSIGGAELVSSVALIIVSIGGCELMVPNKASDNTTWPSNRALKRVIGGSLLGYGGVWEASSSSDPWSSELLEVWITSKGHYPNASHINSVTT